MKVFVNGRFLTQEITGVQQFAREICRELIADGSHEITILTPKNLPPQKNEFASNTIQIGNLKGHLWEQICLPIYLWRQKPFVLINLCNTAPLAIRRQLYTLHDLAFQVNPDWFNFWFSYVYNLLVPVLLRRSQWIFTVSNSIKNEMNSVYAVPLPKIEVIGNKVSRQLLHSLEKKPDGFALNEHAFYLMVGSRNKRKNFEVIINFFESHPELNLLIAGGQHKAFASRGTRLVDCSNIHVLNYVSDAELKWLYQHAKALINPSLYEGFGIPNLEALCFHCTVLCSELPVYHEVCGEAAFYFSIENINTLEACIKKLDEDPQEVQHKKLAGALIFKTYQDQNRVGKIFKALFG